MFKVTNLPIVMKVVNVRAESQLMLTLKPIHSTQEVSLMGERCIYLDSWWGMTFPFFRSVITEE